MSCNNSLTPEKDLDGFSFFGEVTSRSSTNAGGPPGERDILKLNPQRKEAILQATGWNALEPGTLNLKVDENVVHKLLLLSPLVRESGKNIKYPQAYRHIPTMRVGYLYYQATVEYSGKCEPILARRACNPLKSRLEVFAPVNLRTSMSLADGVSVTITVRSVK